MKFLTVFVIALVAIQAVSATTVAERLKLKVQQAPAVESVSATSLEGVPLSSSAALGGSLSASLSSASLSSSVPTVSSQSSGSGCVQQSPCTTVTDSAGSGLSVQDAIKPVDDWLKDFKQRAGAGGADLLKAAKATVSPLIDRLRANQERALDKLHASNEEILQKVEEATTEHIYNILKSQQQKEAKAAAQETKKAEIDAIKEEANQKKLEATLAAAAASASESSASASASSGSKL